MKKPIEHIDIEHEDKEPVPLAQNPCAEARLGVVAKDVPPSDVEGLQGNQWPPVYETK